MASTADYPLNCQSSTPDGFSGWFPITSPSTCNDFCYWESLVDDDQYYSTLTTADPHQVTVIYNGGNATAYWMCVYDAAGDEVTIDTAVGERWVDTYHRFMDVSENKDGNVPFPYWRCHKGSGEKLVTWDSKMVRSALFWECWIVLCAAMMVVQITFGWGFWKGRRRRYHMLLGRVLDGDSNSMEDDVDTLSDVGGSHSLQLSESMMDHSNMPPSLQDIPRLPAPMERRHVHQQQQQRATRCNQLYRCTTFFFGTNTTTRNKQRFTTILQITLLLVLNTVLTITIAFSSLSLMEIHHNPHFSQGMTTWTPACSNLDTVCSRANSNIYQNDTLPDDTTSSSSFSYLLASDAQLYWFNGEFAQMGKRPYPAVCSSHDSCGSCTRKFGRETNRRLREGWEEIFSGRVSGMEEKDALPVPDTLVMNGDLTAYFHPSEKYAYDSIYKDIQGLKNYFPSLGNHDIEHMNGAMYGGDQWNGPPNCNAEHAIGYFKSGFCGQIPNFPSDQIVRYDASSLAYSWERGRYHFVHTHYYPTYEMASMNLGSSLEWLEKDLSIARDAGFATVLFVHAANYLNPALENVILGKNVVAIISGHQHRCFHRKCEGIYPVHQDQLDSGLHVEKCIPAAYDTCQVLNGENLVYAKDIDTENTDILPKKKLKNQEDRNDQPLCPKPAPFYINETDNSLLCRKVRYNHPNFPSNSDDDNSNTNESIPIFWSGSASFETFLRADFFNDRIVINAMALTEDGSVLRYIDENNVPNVLYPFHATSDLSEVVIPI